MFSYILIIRLEVPSGKIINCPLIKSSSFYTLHFICSLLLIYFCIIYTLRLFALLATITLLLLLPTSTALIITTQLLKQIYTYYIISSRANWKMYFMNHPEIAVILKLHLCTLDICNNNCLSSTTSYNCPTVCSNTPNKSDCGKQFVCSLCHLFWLNQIVAVSGGLRRCLKVLRVDYNRGWNESSSNFSSAWNISGPLFQI